MLCVIQPLLVRHQVYGSICARLLKKVSICVLIILYVLDLVCELIFGLPGEQRDVKHVPRSYEQKVLCGYFLEWCGLQQH